MAWRWRYEAADGTTLAAAAAPMTPDAFPSQSDAESWLGENWRPLLDGGVAQVTLLEDAREVYGPMSLSPADG